MKRLCLLAATVCLLSVTLTGCRGNVVVATPEPVTLTFAYPSFDTDAYRSLVEEFNTTYPHITIELNPTRRSSYDPDMTTIDVLVGNQYHVNEFRERGDILDLSPILEHDLSFDATDFHPGALEAFSGAGGIWAIPSGVDPLVMYYNKDLFDGADAQYPQSGWTWDGFLDAALAVNDPDNDTFGYLSMPQALDPLPFVFQHGGNILDDLQEPTRTTYDDPLTIDAVEWYADLVFEHNVIPTPEQMRAAFPGNEGVYRGVFRGGAGLWGGTLSERGGLTWRGRTWTMEWGVVALPRDAQSMTLINAEGFFISSHTQNREACWRWVKFLSERPSYRLVPARRSVLASDAYENEVGTEVAIAARDSLTHAIMISPQLAAFGEVIEETFFPAIEAVLAQEATPEEALAEAQRQAENLVGP
jgi:multiple sugar transport system substrate-binding protein